MLVKWAASCLGLACERALFRGRAGTRAIRLSVAPRLFTVIVTAAMLAACAQSSVVRNNSASFQTAARPASAPARSVAAPTAPRQVAAVPKKHVRPGQRTASQGDASFYEHDTETASGEKFDPQQLTAAHPSLPFGTRLRITNMVNGRSVTVRVNDRGPFVPGRVVDLSHSAAEALQMTERGVVKVKLDVVQ